MASSVKPEKNCQRNFKVSDSTYLLKDALKQMTKIKIIFAEIPRTPRLVRRKADTL